MDGLRGNPGPRHPVVSKSLPRPSGRHAPASPVGSLYLVRSKRTFQDPTGARIDCVLGLPACASRHDAPVEVEHP
jgi:hypothetical protein